MRPNAAKRWCFTFNNYPVDWFFYMAPWLRKFLYIIGEEVGESGTKHLQGYIEFPKKCRPIEIVRTDLSTLPNFETIHWECAKGTRQDNITYCSKDGQYQTNLPIPRPVEIDDIYGWQKKVFDITENKADKRTVHWFWEPYGNYGKTALVRYLVHHKNAIICAGKAADAKYFIVKYKEKHDAYPDVVIFNLPRTMEKFVSYQALEEIKDGVFGSSKYECEPVLMNPPHLLVFANFAPDLTNPGLSLDRFYIRNVRDDEITIPMDLTCHEEFGG